MPQQPGLHNSLVVKVMEEEEDDDIYAAEEEKTLKSSAPVENDVRLSNAKVGEEEANEDEEEGEEVEEEDSDSDIDIITERKSAPDVKVEPAPGSRVKEAKAQSISAPVGEPSPAARDSHAVKIEAPKKETPLGKPGSSYPALKTSTVDVDAKPVYKPSGKAITDMDMDTDFPEDDKPWRKPGTDINDFFNYGFDEFTWASYCLKQQTLRKEVGDSKKQMEEMQNFLSNGMPPIPGVPGAPAPGAPSGIPPMGGPPPEMQQMFQQMMAQGLDPMSMGPEQMMSMMSGGGMGEANQGYGGQNFGQQGQGGHQMGYGGGFGGGGGSGGGNQGGRGRGRRW